jgi:type IV pilus assembly protein PilX
MHATHPRRHDQRTGNYGAIMPPASRQPDTAAMRYQRGATLIVALIFLLLLTILALGASSRSLLQERMAGSLRNSQLAQMSAETALRGAEWKLWKTTSNVGGHLDCLAGSISSDDGCIIYAPASSGPYGPTGAVTTFRTQAGWITTAGATGVAYKGGDGSIDYTSSSRSSLFDELANNPVYIIEDLGPELPPGAGSQHEAGDTGPNNTGAGQLNTHIYRITARATGGNPNAVWVAQSTFDAQATN